ncbi:hypothetical protein M758_6G129400 [Ceratodon purpureus]|uniref:Uncharacterized protein n=1 Tax=Ceratodon purpureus TaxID=3225 RepID=A0A8T0HE49_CERPU|nr:hypothetical protein KC19_6G134900 [Ceratodon purpureus]KAG0613771.1 hypothetical protein M758_6G129400 [Ceratodon purpureus]
MGIKVCSSAQVMPYSVVGAVQYSPTMRILAVKTALVLMIPLFLALPLVCQGLITHSADATDGVESSMEQKAKVRLPNQVYTIRLSPSSRFAGAMQVDNNGGEITDASLLKAMSKRQRLRKMLARRLQDVSDGNCNAVAVATRFRSAQLRRTMGSPVNDPARQRVPPPSRPVKALFILCAKKKVGVRVAMTSPSRAAPGNQHVIPFKINHRRALKQFQVPPLPFIRPPAPPRFQFPPLPFTPPASPQFRFPPLPFTPPASPQFQNPAVSSTPHVLVPQLEVPPLPISLPQLPPLPFTLPAPPLPNSKSLTFPPLPTLPSINIPPLPFQLPSIPCVPSFSGKSLPPP